MKTYYSVGNRNPCGHKHRTRLGAERCARSYLHSWGGWNDLGDEAREMGIGLREYIDNIVYEQPGDCLIAKITVWEVL